MKLYKRGLAAGLLIVNSGVMLAQGRLGNSSDYPDMAEVATQLRTVTNAKHLPAF